MDDLYNQHRIPDAYGTQDFPFVIICAFHTLYHKSMNFSTIYENFFYLFIEYPVFSANSSRASSKYLSYISPFFSNQMFVSR